MTDPATETIPHRAIVIGSSGGIGRALKGELSARGFAVVGLSRSQSDDFADYDNEIDITVERSIVAAAARLSHQAPFSVILVATGLLHGPTIKPEKSLKELDQANLLHLFAVNAVGPALIAKHFVPLLPKRGRCVFAALSARVGSVSDNRAGGWYGYRSSKAALNMVVKTLAIETARANPEAICVAFHPGTVDTGLSKPFQRSVASDRLFSANQAAAHLLDVIAKLEPAQSGRCFAWDGVEISP